MPLLKRQRSGDRGNLAVNAADWEPPSRSKLSSKLDYLSAIEVFQDLTRKEMETMDRAITMNTCQQGKLFYIPGDTGEALFFLKKGRVQLYRLSLEGKKIIEAIGKRLTDAEARLEETMFKSIPSRLASLLIRLSDESGPVIEGYTHQELAEILGTYRETATQTLNEFKAMGLIETVRRRVEIKDPEGLAGLAEA